MYISPPPFLEKGLCGGTIFFIISLWILMHAAINVWMKFIDSIEMFHRYEWEWPCRSSFKWNMFIELLLSDCLQMRLRNDSSETKFYQALSQSYMWKEILENNWMPPYGFCKKGNSPPCFNSIQLFSAYSKSRWWQGLSYRRDKTLVMYFRFKREEKDDMQFSDIALLNAGSPCVFNN